MRGTWGHDVNNDYRMGSRERMREERSRRARRGGGKEGERERERERQKKRNQRNVDTLMLTHGMSCPPCAPMPLM